MPYRDGTGPMGAGSMTGCGLGNCRTGAGFGHGLGMGKGIGKGYRRRFGAWGLGGAWGVDPSAMDFAFAPSTELQKQALIAQQKFLEARLEALKAQVDELQKPNSDTP